MPPAPITTPGSTITVTADITNTGSRDGEEIVQLYVEDAICTFATPVKRLVGFQRISLRPGETKTIEFQLKGNAFEALDENLHPRIEPGEFKISVAPSSVADAGVSGNVDLS